jgi:hypothetical protein
MSRPLMVAGRLQVLERRVAEVNHGRWCDERAGVCVDIDMDLGSRRPCDAVNPDNLRKMGRWRVRCGWWASVAAKLWRRQ